MFKAFWVWSNERKLDTPKELQRLTTKHGLENQSLHLGVVINPSGCPSPFQDYHGMACNLIYG